LTEVATVPAILTTERQTEVALRAKAYTPALIPFMADKEAGTRYRFNSVTTARHVSVRVSIKLYIAADKLLT
jgi:hypothetical protein